MRIYAKKNGLRQTSGRPPAPPAGGAPRLRLVVRAAFVHLIDCCYKCMYKSSLYFPDELVGGYPQQSSGQAVVTGGVVHSPPQYVPSFVSRIGLSIPIARRFSSNDALSRSRAFR